MYLNPQASLKVWFGLLFVYVSAFRRLKRQTRKQCDQMNRKNCQIFLKVAKNNCRAKKCQNADIRAKFETMEPLLKHKIPITNHALKLLIYLKIKKIYIFNKK